MAVTSYYVQCTHGELPFLQPSLLNVVVCFRNNCTITSTYLVKLLEGERPTVVVVEDFENRLGDQIVLRFEILDISPLKLSQNNVTL